MFSYYSRWIYNISDKISHLVKSKTFPLREEAKKSFEFLKLEIENAVIGMIDENLPFVLETDASDIALAATLKSKDTARS